MVGSYQVLYNIDDIYILVGGDGVQGVLRIHIWLRRRSIYGSVNFEFHQGLGEVHFENILLTTCH